MPVFRSLSVFFFNDTATTEIYTLSLHDALPIFPTTPELKGLVITLGACVFLIIGRLSAEHFLSRISFVFLLAGRSEEHTSELQSQSNIVCRLLLEKKNADIGGAR